MATEQVLYEGINKEYLAVHFITAYFIDNDRTQIEVLCTKPDKKSVFSSIVNYKEGDDQWEALKTCINIDQLHESTYQKKKDERREFEKTVMRIAEKDGLIFEFENQKLDTKFYPKILSAMLEDVDNVDHVFALKLACFENKTISESSDNEGKKKLRQAKTKLDVLKTAISIIEG